MGDTVFFKGVDTCRLITVGWMAQHSGVNDQVSLMSTSRTGWIIFLKKSNKKDVGGSRVDLGESMGKNRDEYAQYTFH